MKKLKTYQKFNESLDDANITPEISKLIEDIKSKAESNGVKITLSDDKTVPYIVGEFPCSGYFVDYGNPVLVVAIGKPLKDWIMVLAHESSHMDQCLEKSKYWTDSFIDGREAVEYIDEWCSGKDFSDAQIEDFTRRSREVEWDCERRTIEKAKEYKLPINIKEETQKANSYIWFYTLVKEIRKWNKPGQAPYQIKEVWSQVPDTFDMDYSTVPKEIKDLYKNHCF